MIPLAVPNLAGREAEYLNECVRTNFVSTIGPFVPTLEQMSAELVGFPNAVATNTGTSALHVGLKALGVQARDLVVLPSYTFIASANAVRMCGADAWFFDMDEMRWGLDPDSVAREFDRVAQFRSGSLWHKELNQRIAAVIAVCAAGQPPKLKELVDVAAAVGVPLLLDAAGAAGATYEGRKIGEEVDHAIVSFNGNKTFTAGGGGVFLSRDDDVAAMARHLTTTARTGDDYSHDVEGFNYRMTNVQAAIGCAQLEQSETFLERKRSIDATYRAAWVGSDLAPFPRFEWMDSSCWMTGALLPEGGRLEVSSLVNALMLRGVQARGFWKPMHLQTPYALSPRTTMTQTDTVWSRVLTLPSSTSLSHEDQNRVVEAVLELVGSRDQCP